ncbi:hypothetical protein QUA82_07795 [Microcoleus sp. F8-D3]
MSDSFHFGLTKTFKGGTRHAIDRWARSKASKIENPCVPRIYLAQVNPKSRNRAIE